MAAHGVPPYTFRGKRSEDEHQQELRKIDRYKQLDRIVHDRMNEYEFSSETLQKLSELLTTNPEYYTIWNYRRRVLQYQFSVAESNGSEQVASIIRDDLQFLFPLLRSFPKCYWIWNYRLWLLEEAKRILSVSMARKFWQEELALVGKMLNLDNRNFHGWGYRRAVVESLEGLEGDGHTSQSMANEEFAYAKKMISTNLSNFSAWHYRTKLIQRLLNEENADDAERKHMLDDELNLIHRALCDPYDQSLWFYHQNLMCNFDTCLSSNPITPNLSDSDRITYLKAEIEAIEEMLDGAEDCKYIYQALIDCTILQSKLLGGMSSESKTRILRWLAELKKLDPLRSGRWLDFERSLQDL